MRKPENNLTPEEQYELDNLALPEIDETLSERLARYWKSFISSFQDYIP